MCADKPGVALVGLALLYQQKLILKLKQLQDILDKATDDEEEAEEDFIGAVLFKGWWVVLRTSSSAKN